MNLKVQLKTRSWTRISYSLRCRGEVEHDTGIPRTGIEGGRVQTSTHKKKTRICANNVWTIVVGAYTSSMNSTCSTHTHGSLGLSPRRVPPKSGKSSTIFNVGCWKIRLDRDESTFKSAIQPAEQVVLVEPFCHAMLTMEIKRTTTSRDLNKEGRRKDRGGRMKCFMFH